MLYGENITRMYESSWLLPSGKPENGLTTIIQAHKDDKCSDLVDSFRLKEFSNKLVMKEFSSRTLYLDFVRDNLQKKHSCEVVVDNIHSKGFKEFFETKQPVMAQGLRFICQRSGQPYIGKFYLVLENETMLSAGQKSILCAELTKYRNAEMSLNNYIHNVFEGMESVLQNKTSSVASIHLNRRGGISFQAIRSAEDKDFSTYRMRSITE